MNTNVFKKLGQYVIVSLSISILFVGQVSADYSYTEMKQDDGRIFSVYGSLGPISTDTVKVYLDEEEVDLVVVKAVDPSGPAGNRHELDLGEYENLESAPLDCNALESLLGMDLDC